MKYIFWEYDFNVIKILSVRCRYKYCRYDFATNIVGAATNIVGALHLYKRDLRKYCHKN